MKSSAVLASVLLVLSLAGCAQNQKQQVDVGAEKAKVKAVVDQYAQALQTEDMGAIDRMMSHDADMVTFGTDANERWVGWDSLRSAIQQQFAAFDSTRVNVYDQMIKVHPSGEVAWFSERLDVFTKASGQPVNLHGVRMTGVLENRNGNWVFVQFHVSMPVSGQAAQY